jgi:nitroreductase
MNFQSFEALATNRNSVRKYTAQPVPMEMIESILTVARSAPSGGNLQPGKFVVMSGEPLQAFSDTLCAAIEDGLEITEQYTYFPDPMPRPLLRRQAETAGALYKAAGIDRKDVRARDDLFLQNYRFFSAPIGIVVTIDQRLGSGCYMDMGMTLQTLLLAAQAAGLASCGIGALANYGPFIGEYLGLEDNEIVVCGIALGYEETGAAINQFRTKRSPLKDYATFIGRLTP